MTISKTAWNDYISKLKKINEKAASEMLNWIRTNGSLNIEAAVNYAYALSAKYGEASAALACEMYDAIALASGKFVPAAMPAEVASFDYVNDAIRAAADTAPSTISPTVGRMVKLAAADTMLKNAARDGAEFAWIPAGDTCAFCITLASRGWQRASKKALRNGHAEHIHANCNCEYCIRFDSTVGVAGYSPDKYEKIYYDAAGRTPKERINSLRREQYAENKDYINEQKRAAYAARKDDSSTS